MTYLGRSNQSWNSGGGGGGGFIVPLAAIGLAGWAIWDLVAVSAVLAAAAGVYVLVAAVFYYIVNDNYVSHSGLVKFLLLASVAVIAATDLFVFRSGAVRFVVADALAVVLYAGALIAGLWGVLSLLWRVVALAMLVLLIAAPFSEFVEAKEKWLLRITVRDQSCAAVAAAEVRCELVSTATGDVVGEDGPRYTSEFGVEYFVFDGSPRGKNARCFARKDPHPTGSVIVEPGWIGATEATIRVSPADRPVTGACPED